MNGNHTAVLGTEFAFSFHLPTQIEFGWGKVAQLGERLAQQGVKRVFLVSDKGVEQAGLLARVTEAWSAAGVQFALYTDVEPDPSLETINQGAEVFQAGDYDCIVAVGGGSPIDTAKGIRVVAANGGSIGDYAGVNRVSVSPRIPLIAIPTTSGTGSEVTIFGVYSDWQNNVKVTVTSPYMAPTMALVDPALTLSLPPKMTAASGIDALAHGVETYFSLRSYPASDALALEAISTVAAHLRRAVQDGADVAARVGMAHGSLLAGMAFNNGFLGLAHAIGSALSGHCHVPHGVAIGLLLPHVVQFNAQARPDKAAMIAKLLGAKDDSAPEQAAALIAQLVRDIGLPTRLAEVGVPVEKLPDIAKDSFKSGMMKFNPRTPSETEVRELLERMY